MRLTLETLELHNGLSCWLLDGLASKQLWGLKGVADTRMCVECVKFFAEHSPMADTDGVLDGLVCVTHERDNLIFATNISIYARLVWLAIGS